jgi:hypothetical protein
VRLTARQIDIVRGLRDQATGRTRELFGQVLDGTLSKGDIGAVCEKISDEFLTRGTDRQYEPNKYGIELEQLLDAVNRGRLF